MSLTIKNLVKSFGDRIIFDSFSYEFAPSGVYAVLGESGVGKTTLLRLIAGLDKNYSGEITGGGFENISFAFQEYRLFPSLSAIDNVVMAVSDGKDEVIIHSAKKLLISLGFSKEDMLLLPSELSGGMKQRVSLARAFLKNSPILLLDEPTKELDEENAKAVIDTIADISRYRLVIMVTHRPEDLEQLSPITIRL